MERTLDPVGRYSCMIQGGKYTQNDNGKTQMEVEFIAYHCLQNGSWQQLDQPLTRRMFLSTEGKATEYTFKKLKAIGFNGDWADPAFTGDAVEIDCKPETYNNEPRRSWELVNWGGGNEAAPENDVSRMQALWDAQAGNSAKSASAPKPTAAKAPPKPAPPPAAKPDSDPVSFTVVSADEAYAKYQEMGKEPNDETWAQELGKYIDEKGYDDQERMTADDWQAFTEGLVIPF